MEGRIEIQEGRRKARKEERKEGIKQRYIERIDLKAKNPNMLANTYCTILLQKPGWVYHISINPVWWLKRCMSCTFPPPQEKTCLVSVAMVGTLAMTSIHFMSFDFM